MTLVEYITGVSDYKTMLEMAKKGDRYKCDLGLKELLLQENMSMLVKTPDLPLVFMRKLKREAVESGEISHEDICASAFACMALILESNISMMT